MRYVAKKAPTLRGRETWQSALGLVDFAITSTKYGEVFKLGHLGFDKVSDVRQGRYIVLDLAETDRARAEASVKAMCEKLLANTVIEKYEIELKP